MTLMTVDQKTNTYGISIKPKLKEDKESFSVAFVNLDQKFLLPTRIIMLSPDGKSKKDFQIDRSKTFPNKSINPNNFEGKPLGPPWKIVRNPAGEDRPRAMPRVGRRRHPAGPAAAGPAPWEPGGSKPHAGDRHRRGQATSTGPSSTASSKPGP